MKVRLFLPDGMRLILECARVLAVRADAITVDSDPYVVMRPEGEWDRESVLDRSASRPAVA